MRLDSSGRLGLGTSSPLATLQVQSSLPQVFLTSSASTSADKFGLVCGFQRANDTEPEGFSIIGSQSTSTDNVVHIGGFFSEANAATAQIFYTAANNTTRSGTERVRIDSSGRFLVGTSSAATTFFGGTITPQLQLEGTSNNTSTLSLTRRENGNAAASLCFGKTRGGTTVVQANDGLGFISFEGSDGTNLIRGASITAAVDGTPGTNDMPGRLVFSTTADGASSPTERMRINNAGQVGIGTTSPTGFLHVESPATTAGWQLRLDSVGLANESGFFRTASDNYEMVLRNAAGGLSYLTNTGGASTSTLEFVVQGSERARIDSSGRLLVGTSTSITTLIAAGLQVQSTGSNAYTSIGRWDNNAANPGLIFNKSRGGSVGTFGIVQSGDSLGEVSFTGDDGSAFVYAARIQAQVDNTPGTNDMPGRLVFSTTADGGSSPTERMRITNAGDLNYGTGGGIVDPGTGTTDGLYYNNTDKQLVLSRNGGGSLILRRRISDGVIQGFYRDTTLIGTVNVSTTDLTIANSTSGSIVFNRAASSESARIDSSGRLLVGTSSARDFNNALMTPRLQLEGLDVSQSAFGLARNSANTGGPVIGFGKSRGAVAGSMTAVIAQDDLGRIQFQGADGTQLQQAAEISAHVDGTPGTNDMPGRLVFSTTADGAATPTERMRIGNDGNVYFGKTTTATATVGIAFQPSIGYGSFTRGSGAVLGVNRQTDDGDLVQFLQADNLEGTISVSGSTVSYNGAHLSRWSQLPGGAERIEILRGTVLSNIDEMCDWGEEENEQLNRMKVSDVEGDPNVAGVFQGWDDDDDTYTDDFYCAMTGDFIIRIAEGVTVQRGDLLMSAGDGTAKPQDDDIIRSKTIAKVTSTHVTCTYDDGSYCVPCVLMAC
jgi:hypothetical protein